MIQNTPDYAEAVKISNGRRLIEALTRNGGIANSERGCPDTTLIDS